MTENVQNIEISKEKYLSLHRTEKDTLKMILKDYLFKKVSLYLTFHRKSGFGSDTRPSIHQKW